MIWRGSSRLGCVVPVHFFWWFSELFLRDFLGAFSGPFFWGFGGGCMHEPFVVLFPLIPLPNLWAKGLNFGVFGVLGLEELLAGFLQFLLIWQLLVDKNFTMDYPWGVPTIPKVLHKFVERFGRSGVGFRGVDPRVLFIPSCPVLTGLTGASDRSDRCMSIMGFASGELLYSCVFGSWCCWSALDLLGVVLLGFV
jgi:hypothetical protein